MLILTSLSAYTENQLFLRTSDIIFNFWTQEEYGN